MVPGPSPTPAPGESRTSRIPSGCARWMRFAAVTFAAFALLGLALPWLSPDDPDVQGLQPLGYGLGFGLAAAVSVFYARYLPRYAFTIGPDGFHEEPRHAVGTTVHWSRVARLEPRPYGRRLQLRGSLGELLGITRVPGRRRHDSARDGPRADRGSARDFPATFSWRTPWLLLVSIGAGNAFFVVLGVQSWLEQKDPSGLLLAGMFFAMPVIVLMSTVRRRTVIAADQVSCWRGLARRDLEWRDVTDVVLEDGYPRKLEVTVRLSSGRVECILPTDGDVTGVLLAARAAHALSLRSATGAVAQPSSSPTARRGSA